MVTPNGTHSPNKSDEDIAIASDKVREKVRELYAEGRKAKLTDQELRQAAQLPDDHDEATAPCIGWNGLMLMTVMAAVIAVAFQSEQISTWFYYCERQALIGLLPFVDWTPLYLHQCIFDNPYFDSGVDAMRDRPTCAFCDSRKVLVYNEATDPASEALASTAVFMGVPIVLQRAPGSGTVSADQLRATYGRVRRDKLVRNVDRDKCRHGNTLANDTTTWNVPDILTEVVGDGDGDTEAHATALGSVLAVTPAWSAYSEHCEPVLQKAVRQLCQQPLGVGDGVSQKMTATYILQGNATAVAAISPRSEDGAHDIIEEGEEDEEDEEEVDSDPNTIEWVTVLQGTIHAVFTPTRGPDVCPMCAASLGTDMPLAAGDVVVYRPELWEMQLVNADAGVSVMLQCGRTVQAEALLHGTVEPTKFPS
eukprot:m.604090 g.604090  ORF g.604090 m.604090 type:complete len:422 (-) comp22457_c0_seq14:1897-3162(-)